MDTTAKRGKKAYSMVGDKIKEIIGVLKGDDVVLFKGRAGGKLGQRAARFEFGGGGKKKH